MSLLGLLCFLLLHARKSNMCQKSVHKALWDLKDEQDTALGPLSNSAPRLLENEETAAGRRGRERAWWNLKWASAVMIKPQKTIEPG